MVHENYRMKILIVDNINSETERLKLGFSSIQADIAMHIIGAKP